MLKQTKDLSHRDWLDAVLDPEEIKTKHGLSLPRFPSEQIQCKYSGRTLQGNMQQANQFYAYVLSLGVFERADNPLLMDFGAGWGRITRFFLRHAESGRIWAVDRMAESLKIMADLGFMVKLANCDRLPPLQLDGASGFNLITAYSVFSHLSEPLADAWLGHLYDLLAPGGTMVYTTRGEKFIWQIQAREKGESSQEFNDALPRSAEIRRLRDAGAFQFYPIGVGNSELAGADYGEAWIPPQWIVRKHGEALIQMTEYIPSVDQFVVAVRKPMLD